MYNNDIVKIDTILKSICAKILMLFLILVFNLIALCPMSGGKRTDETFLLLHIYNHLLL